MIKRLIWTLLLLFSVLIGSSLPQDVDVDEIDSAFTDILSRVDTLSRMGPDIFGRGSGGGDFFGNPLSLDGVTGSSDFLPRLRNILGRASRIMSELRRTGMADEAIAIKQYIINLATSVPFFDGIFLPRTSNPVDFRDRTKITNRVEDLDSLLGRFEKVTEQFRSLPSSEKDKFIEKNSKNLRQLNEKHSKLAKKCFYLRNRVEYLLNELRGISSSRASPSSSSKNTAEKLSVWKRFIENNEYILNQRLTREERETLYSFLSSKLREAEPDLREAENFLFE